MKTFKMSIGRCIIHKREFQFIFVLCLRLVCIVIHLQTIVYFWGNVKNKTKIKKFKQKQNVSKKVFIFLFESVLF